VTLKPGKGLNLLVNEQIFSWQLSALETLQDAYENGAGGDCAQDEDPKKVFDTIVSALKPGPEHRDYQWHLEQDDFGQKLYCERPYPDGTLRVTLVLTKKKELRLDIRAWYDG
jgi:surface antigen